MKSSSNDDGHMMVSILIPTYNYNARALVVSMHQLSQAEGVEAEVLIGDDASTAETAWMDEVEQKSGIRIIHAPRQLGRAGIRNLLASESNGEWLLFVDADAVVPADFSLKKYLALGHEATVICGGLRHPAVNPNPAGTLRYKYERHADRQRSAAQRSLHPHSKLSTFNLLVRRDVFMSIRFDERCEEYGYEDALFGYQLGEHGILVVHIDNALIHSGIDDNAAFLEKTETAMRTLHRIHHLMPQDSGIIGAVNQLRRWRLIPVVRLFYRMCGSAMRANLLSRHPLLPLFQFYKVGYYVRLRG